MIHPQWEICVILPGDGEQLSYIATKPIWLVPAWRPTYTESTNLMQTNKLVKSLNIFFNANSRKKGEKLGKYRLASPVPVIGKQKNTEGQD